MMKFIIFLLLLLFSGGAAINLAPGVNPADHSGGGGFASSGGGAPAPEMGAGVLGMLLVGGAAFYVRRRAQG